MKAHALHIACGLIVSMSLAAATLGQLRAATAPPLPIGHTQGFGADKILDFAYTQHFDCVVEPMDDRNYSGRPAAVEPAQFNFPQCQIGAPSSISPSGALAASTDKVFFLIPFFESNPKEPAFNQRLGYTLKGLFGFVPDAFKLRPGVAVQCPEPGPPLTQLKGRPGTCTMHPTEVDLGPMLTQMHLFPPKTIFRVPLPNHMNLLANSQINQAAEWWQVIFVLVSDPKAWPAADGSNGVTSLPKLRSAQSHGQAGPDVPSNFFTFFSSVVTADAQRARPFDFGATARKRR